MQITKEIEYDFKGDEMQMVEITLDQGCKVVAESGALMYMEQGINLEARSNAEANVQSIFKRMAGRSNHVTVGEGVYVTEYTNNDQVKRKIAFGSPYQGKIVPIDLRSFGNRIICQKNAFLCAAKGVSVDIALHKQLTLLSASESDFVMEKIEGEGTVFLHTNGTIVERHLELDEVLRVDLGCLVALSSLVQYDLQKVGRNLDQEGVYLATLSGPGTVWLQSTPYIKK